MTKDTHTEQSRLDTVGAQDEVDNYKKVISYINDKLDEQIDKLEELRDAEIDLIEAQKDALEEQHNLEIDSIDKEIDKLEDAKSAREDYWNSRVNLLKEENDEINNQISLQEKLEALAEAKSKKVRVYKNGQFVYQDDSEAITNAQQELNDLLRQQELDKQVKQLEEQRDKESSIYDQLS